MRTVKTMVVALIGAGIGVSCSQEPPAGQAAQTPRCFASETQADKELFRVETDTGNIRGFYGWYPAEKDAHWGDFSGAEVGSAVEGVLEAHGEGIVIEEPFHFLLSEDEVRIRTWELTDKVDDKYVVAWSDLHSLPEISCDQMVIPASATASGATDEETQTQAQAALAAELYGGISKALTARLEDKEVAADARNRIIFKATSFVAQCVISDLAQYPVVGSEEFISVLAGMSDGQTSENAFRQDYKGNAEAVRLHVEEVSARCLDRAYRILGFEA